MDDFSLQQPAARVIRFWWLVLAFCVIGGLAGWLISDLQPAQYEAEARFNLYLDMVRTGKIDRLDEDVLIQTAGGVMSSPAVINEVITQAAAKGIQVDSNRILEVFFPEQRNQVWILRIRLPDPQAAAEVANLWADVGRKALTEALTHAEKAESLRRYLEAQESCLLQAYVGEAGASQCAVDSLEKMQAELASTGAVYLQEKSAAHGVSPAIDFSFESPATAPSTPSRFQRSTLILAGAAIGLLLGAWLAGNGLPEKLTRPRRAK